MTITPATIAALQLAQVVSVYSGRPGCCCGCRGIHRHNSAHVTEAEHRGDAVGKINDRHVQKVLGLLQSAVATNPGAISIDETASLFSATLAGRHYVVYLVERASVGIDINCNA